MAVTPRILDVNLVQGAGTVISASSQDPAFTAGKLRDPLRSQTLRTLLGWNVNRAINDAFDFKEGSDKRVAILPSANYPTGLALATALQTALNEAGLSPDSLAPSLWLRPEGLVSIANGAGVSQWNDDSGNGRHFTQATGNLQPTLAMGALNGRSAVRFDGSGRRLVSTATMANILDGSGQGTIMVVFAVDTDDTGASMLLAQSNVNRALYVNPAGPSVTARAYDGTQDEATKTGLTLGAWHIAVWQYGGNINATTDNVDTAAFVSTASGAQTDLAQTLVLGGDGAGNELKGFIAEVIVCQPQLTQENRRRIARYLCRKYGLTEASGAPAFTNTYTATYDTSTSKHVVARATGAASLDLLHSTGKQAASSASKDLGYDVSADDTGATSYTADNATYHGREWVAVDLGSAQTFTACAVINHNSGAGGTYKLQWSAASVLAALTAPDSPSPQTLSADSSGALRYAYPASQSKRFLVLMIEDVGNTSGYSDVGIWYVGAYRAPSFPYSENFSPSLAALSTAELALQGAKRSTRRQRRDDWPLEWLDLPDADRVLFEAFAAATPMLTNFFFAFDSTNDPTKIRYVYADTPIGLKYVPGLYWTVSFHIVEALG